MECFSLFLQWNNLRTLFLLALVMCLIGVNCTGPLFTEHSAAKSKNENETMQVLALGADANM